MDVTTLIFLFLAGAAGGFVAAIYGTGAGVLVAPLSIIVLRTAGVTSLVATHLAFGTTLAAVALASAVTLMKAKASGEVDWPAARPGMVGAVLAGIVGSLIAARLQAPVLQRILGFVLGIASLRLFGLATSGNRERVQTHSVPGMFGVGAAAGAASGLTGGGGDALALPVLVSGYGFSQRKAGMVALAMNLAGTLAGAVTYGVTGLGDTLVPAGNAGYVTPGGVVPLAAGAILGSMAGSSLATRISVERSANVVGVVLLVAAIRMIFFS
jgi:uncharacterized membrane protein YfcA